MKKKLKQNLQRLRFELQRLAFRAQLAPKFVKFVVGETPKASRGLFHTYCRSLVIHEVSASLEFLRIPSGHTRVSWCRLAPHKACFGMSNILPQTGKQA